MKADKRWFLSWLVRATLGTLAALGLVLACIAAAEWAASQPLALSLALFVAPVVALVCIEIRR